MIEGRFVIVPRTITRVRRIVGALTDWLCPEYELDADCWFEDNLAPSGSVVKSWRTPNRAMKPLTRMARFKVWRWRRSLPAPATNGQRETYLSGFRQFNEVELRAIPNEIKEPTVYRRRDGVAARWYDHKPVVVPLASARPSGICPPVKNPWLEKKD